MVKREHEMLERALVGGFLAALIGLGMVSTARAQDTNQPSPPPVILTLPGRPIESADRAMTEAIRDSIQAPKPSAVQEWVLQPDGSMRNTRTGLAMVIRNICAPGDMDHEFALAAYRQAQAGKLRRR
jgi:hypothetical protein